MTGMAITPSQFERQLAFLRRAGYQDLSLGELAGRLETGQSLPRRAVAITFDDGYADNYRYAWPLLKKYGYGATIFVITDFISQDTRFDRARPPHLKPAPLLTTEQLREMAAGGVEFGSHGCTHQPLTGLDAATRTEELGRSRRDLAALLDREIISFAYPYSRTDASCQAAVAEAGYRLGVAGKGPYFSPYQLNRLDPVGLSQPLLAFKMSRTVREIRSNRLYGQLRHEIYKVADRLKNG